MRKAHYENELEAWKVCIEQSAVNKTFAEKKGDREKAA